MNKVETYRKMEAIGNEMEAIGNEMEEPEMLAEYDFSGGERGRYAARYAQGTNLVALSPDVAEIFPDSESVNEALRSLVKVARQTLKSEHFLKREAA